MGIEDKNSRKIVLFISLVCLVVCALFIVIESSYCLHLYSKDPIAVVGELETIDYHHFGLEVYVDGCDYVLYNPQSSVRSFGFKDDVNRGTMYTFLQWQTGKEACLKYVETAFRQKYCISLSVDGYDYIVQMDAVEDLIETKKIERWTGLLILFLAIICILYAKKKGIVFE